MNHLGEDVRFGVRQVRRAPGYAAFTVLVLALGTGTVTAMFTIAYAVLLKPLPFEADRSLYQPVVNTIAGDDTPRLPYDEIRGLRGRICRAPSLLPLCVIAFTSVLGWRTRHSG
jgi:hypothetical protein